MIACVQRVSRASVDVDGERVGEIGQGLLVLLGVETGDTEEINRWVADKVAELRIFTDEQGKMSRSVKDINGGILVVSQFTLAGDCRKGRRPDFGGAMEPKTAEQMYETFVGYCKAHVGDGNVATGRFAAMMDVSLNNDGPVTLLVQKRNEAVSA